MGDEVNNLSYSLRKSDFPPDWPPLDADNGADALFASTIFDIEKIKNAGGQANSTSSQQPVYDETESEVLTLQPVASTESSVDESSEISLLTTSTRYSNESAEQISQRILQRAIDGNDYIIERNVPNKIAQKINMPDGYSVEYDTYNSSSDSGSELVDIKLRIVSSDDASKQQIRMDLAFDNGKDIKGIITTTRYGFFALPENYRHDVTELDDGTFKHDFICIKENEINVKEQNKQIQQQLFAENQREVTISNLSRQNAEKIKAPDGYSVTLTDNKYGYTDVLIKMGTEEEKSFETKLKYCFSRKINAMSIGPSKALGQIKQGERLYNVEIPKGYIDRVEEKDGKATHNFIYVGESESGRTGQSDSSAETGEKKKEKRKSYSSGESGWKKFTNWLGNLFKSSDDEHMFKTNYSSKGKSRSCRRAHKQHIKSAQRSNGRTL